MTTLRKYVDVVKAEMDKSLLEAAGIPAFVAGENSAAIGYGSILAEIHLQVQDADAARARQVLQDNNEAIPLSDDFIPPAVPSLPDDSISKAVSKQKELETEDSDTKRAVFSAVATLVFVFAMFVAFTWWKDSHSAAAYYRSGYVKWTKGNLDGAIADYTRAIELSPRYKGHVYDARGLAKWSKGDLDNAIADYNTAIALDPNNARAYANRGIAKMDKGDLEGALTDYDTAIELRPEDARTYYNRSFIERGKNDLSGAIADLDKAIELNPKYTLAYEGRGLTKGMQGDLDGSLADYSKTLELNPRNARALSGRAFTKRMNGDTEGSLADYSEAISLNPTNTSAYYGRGVDQYDSRHWSEALLDFRKASALKPVASKSETLPDYAAIRIWMTHAKLGNRNAATDALKQYLLTRTIGKPGDWPSTITRFLTGDILESDFLKAADSGDEKHLRDQKCEAYFYVGTLKLIEGDKSAATDYFTKCLETGAKKNYEYQSAAAELEALKH